jgi:hypothetical protein
MGSHHKKLQPGVPTESADTPQRPSNLLVRQQDGPRKAVGRVSRHPNRRAAAALLRGLRGQEICRSPLAPGVRKPVRAAAPKLNWSR